jgi:hypothetical protein
MISRFDTNMMNIILLLHILPKIKNDHQLLNFYTARSAGQKGCVNISLLRKGGGDA